MDRGEDGVRIARTWIGTPYRHQASCRGAGCDCLGLLRGVWRELYRAGEPELVPPYTPDWFEVDGRDGLLDAARRWLTEAELRDEVAGDVIVFRMARGAVAKHVGLQVTTGEAAGFVHAYSGHGVVETALTPAWRRRIAGRFRFPKEI